MVTRINAKILPCLIGILICLTVGMIASWATMPQVIHWYPLLKQPSFTPPPYVFGPIWTFLYIVMGIAVGLIFQTHQSPFRKRALSWFAIQLCLNGLWSFIFFSWHQLAWALVDLGLLWICLIVTIYYFYKTKPLCAALLLPYLLWSSFAFAINANVVYLNCPLNKKMLDCAVTINCKTTHANSIS
jgi:benzodiazapine receptor